MKLVAISDTHGRHDRILIPSQNDLDIIVFAGDFCKDKTDQECVDFLDWFEKHKFRKSNN